MGKRYIWLAPLIMAGLISGPATALDLSAKYSQLYDAAPSRDEVLEASRADANLYTYALQRMLELDGKYTGPLSGLLTTSTISAVNAYCDGADIDCAAGPLSFQTMRALTRSIALSIKEEQFENDPTMLPGGWAVMPAEGVTVDILRTETGIKVTLSGSAEETSSTRVFVAPPRPAGTGVSSNEIHATVLDGDPSVLVRASARLQGVKGGDEGTEVSSAALPILDGVDKVTVSADVAGEGNAQVRPLIVLRHKAGAELNLSLLLSAS